MTIMSLNHRLQNQAYAVFNSNKRNRQQYFFMSNGVWEKIDALKKIKRNSLDQNYCK